MTEPQDQETDPRPDGEAEIPVSVAEGVLLRELEIRDDAVDVLRTIEADVRLSPPVLADERIDKLESIGKELEAFAEDLRDAGREGSEP